MLVFHTSDAPECEYQKWLEGLKQELSSMDAKGVLESVDPEYRDNGIAPVPSKLVLTKKPMEDNEIELNESMGATEVADITNKSWKARVRHVACGNFEQGTKPLRCVSGTGHDQNFDFDDGVALTSVDGNGP